MILGVDPGFIESAWMLLDGTRIVEFGKERNSAVLARVANCFGGAERLAIETLQSYGMPVGQETLETGVWVGRFWQAWPDPSGVTRYYRKTICGHLCNDARASDKNIRQALIDRYGGDSVAIGGVKCELCRGAGEVSCKACNGRGFVLCAECHGNSRKWKTKACLACGNTGGVVCQERQACPECNCRKWKYPPGPLADFNCSDHWSALAVACTAADGVIGV